MPSSSVSINHRIIQDPSRQQVTGHTRSGWTAGVLSQQVSRDCSTARNTTSHIRQLPVSLRSGQSISGESKNLSRDQFNILTTLKDSGEIKKFVDEHLQELAKINGITLDQGTNPQLQTKSDFDSAKPTSVEFVQFGKDADRVRKYVSLSIGDTQMRQITPEVMGILAKSFNVDSSIQNQLRSELKETNSQLKEARNQLEGANSHLDEANSENQRLQEQNSQLTQKTEDLQTSLDALKKGKADCEKRLGLLLDQATRGEEAQTELKHLGTKNTKLNEEIAQYETEIAQCKTELDSTKQALHENQQTLSKLKSDHQQQLTEMKAGHNIEKMALQNRAEIAESGFESQKGEISNQTQHLLKLGKRSYWPAALAGVATAVALVFMGIKASGLSSAEDDLKDADNDANYDQQGKDAGEAAVSNKVKDDRADYENAIADGREDDAKAIAARYLTGPSGEPVFSTTTLTESGKTAMESVRTEGYAQGVKEAKIEAIDKAKNTVAQAKEAIGLLGGAAGLSLLLTGGFFTYARSKNKHLAATEKSINQALVEGKPFKAPEEKGFVKFTATLNRFVSGSQKPATATLTSR